MFKNNVIIIVNMVNNQNMKKIMCVVLLILLGISSAIFENKNQVEDCFKGADSIKIIRVGSGAADGVFCGDYIIEDVHKITQEDLVGITITYNDFADIYSIIKKLNVNIIKTYYIDGCRVVDGRLCGKDFYGFDKIQIVIGDNVVIGFPTIINGF